ncbi:DUF4350 domain-containing protein [Galbibacter sp. BG1]|uniref:DUF4350 domain-containing protein n=1 Tax=Galbibacter sp. BG1 TaxID=1170699 RepID=UPI0015BE9C54|nr:DUF4350 domain-containing protein [Galbibacter sp. BG1]QLE01588.1 DUF4350 domain-containing protein [Galbibacter sp. BG1]
MSKTLKIYITVLVLLFVGAVVFEVSRPRPIDWSPSFNETHAKPYGLKILRYELANLFPNDSVIDIKSTLYEFLDQNYNWLDSTYTHSGSILVVDPYPDLDAVTVNYLLEYVAQGNFVFIASEEFPQLLKDTLAFETQNRYDLKGDALFSLANQKFRNDTIKADKGASNIYFKKLPDTSTTVLGFQKFEEKKINFIRLKHGDGQFYLHTQPYLFTNYYFLKDNNQQYIADVLSYIPDGNLYYDAAVKYGTANINSPLRYIFTQPALQWAWLLALFFIVTFILFNAKRRQRVMRIINPLQNTTVQFTKTVANLYFETKDHANIIDKKITYFLEKVRRDYYLDTQNLNEKFINQLALKSGNELEQTKKLIDFIIFLRSKTAFSEQDLIDLNKRIEKFYQKK